MKKMSNDEILKVYKGISDLIEAKIPLNIKTSFTLAKNKKILQPFIETIEHERINIYKKYGNETEDGAIKVEKIDIPKVEKDLDELLNINTKVEITKLTLNDFGDNNINIDILEELMPIIIE